MDTGRLIAVNALSPGIVATDTAVAARPELASSGSARPPTPEALGLLDDLRARIDRWGIDAEVSRYAGAGHSFSAPRGPLRHEEADRAAWDDAVAFLRAHTEG
jgi:dienelactone hydrolase